jgi:hypothetical protein
MDSRQLLERIESGKLNIEEEIDGLKVRVELEAADQLGMLLKRIEIEGPARKGPVEAILRKQAAAIVEKVTCAGELKVIEVDGFSDAVQIRSKKPQTDGYVEVILRNGNFISLARKPAALHISKGDFQRLVNDLGSIL